MKKSLLTLSIIIIMIIFILSGCSTEVDRLKKENSNLKARIEELERTSSLNDDSNILISRKNNQPIIYDENDISISFNKCTYIEGASDIRFVFDIENNSDKIINMRCDNVIVDDMHTRMLFPESQYKSNENVSSNYYIELENLQKGNVENFNKITFTINLSDEENTFRIEKHIEILREVFENQK